MRVAGDVGLDGSDEEFSLEGERKSRVIDAGLESGSRRVDLAVGRGIGGHGGVGSIAAEGGFPRLLAVLEDGSNLGRDLEEGGSTGD